MRSLNLIKHFFWFSPASVPCANSESQTKFGEKADGKRSARTVHKPPPHAHTHTREAARTSVRGRGSEEKQVGRERRCPASVRLSLGCRSRAHSLRHVGLRVPGRRVDRVGQPLDRPTHGVHEQSSEEETTKGGQASQLQDQEASSVDSRGSLCKRFPISFIARRPTLTLSPSHSLPRVSPLDLLA